MAVGDSGHSDRPIDDLSAGEYCRALERYLCRKNDGHLIRIVGPAFELVTGWAARGVPITIAQRGIDRYFERYYAKGPRRRPVRIEFCEADVLDLFDEWRRAVGVSAYASDAESSTVTGDAYERGSATSRGSAETLPAHLDRVVARLTALRRGSDRTLDDVLDAIVRELDAARTLARGVRGRARAGLLARLAELDAHLIDAVRGRLSDPAVQDLRRDAEVELAPFRSRMPPEVFERSVAACMDRLLRDRNRLPRVSLE